MRRCPKCGSTTIAGPRYLRRSFDPRRLGLEALRFTCCTCGYSVDRPPLDKEKGERLGSPVL